MLKNPEKTKSAIVEWIREYFKCNGANFSAVVGISGGKDSTVVAALCKEALGNERVIGVLMPDGKQADIQDSIDIVNHLGIKYYTVDISTATSALKGTLSADFELSKNTLINLPPRIRMTTLYAIAQSVVGGAFVVNTCNASEDYVGYSTKFGDSAGDFSPLTNFLVHEVRQIGACCDIPQKFVQKTPTDGLSGMSDEEKLGFTYDELDNYILTGICKDEDKKNKIDRLHKINLHKIKPMPCFELEKNQIERV